MQQYQYQYNKKHTKVRSGVITATVIVLLAIVFVVAVYQFRKPKEQDAGDIVKSIEDVFVQTKGPLFVPEEGLFPNSRSATIYDSVTGQSLGTAYRGTKNDKYFFEIVAPLAEIDREIHYYQVWLVRAIPYDYFSAGEMVTNELGQFILEWEGEEEHEYGGYSQIVITREAYDGPEGPSTHIAEGEFR
ncbi:MAG: hypothetical protein ABIH21_05390 [Patescibacteria group bacterium]